MPESISQEQALDYLPKLEEVVGNGRGSIADAANLSACYFTLGMSEKALPLTKTLYERCPADATIALNYAMALREYGEHSQSAVVLSHAYHLEPDTMMVRMAYAESLLRAGNWHDAWPIYDNCRLTQQGAAQYLQLPPQVREWNGEPIPGGRLLLINEGGIGDRLSYPRWLNELTRRGIDWVFYPFEEVFGFFERIFPREKLLRDGDPINVTHWTTPFALPAKLDSGPTQIPVPLRFIARPDCIAKYKIPRTDNVPVVGLAWQASELWQGGRKIRSLSEGQAMRLAAWTHDRAHWVNLNYGAHLGRRMDFPFTNYGFTNWEETAGLIANLDAVVSVDTGTFHLAAAMGKPTILILPGHGDWKYGYGPKTNFYPDVKLYRNPDYGFEKALNALIGDIRKGLLQFDKP